MNKIELFDSVELLVDYKEENVIPSNNTIYKKGSTGTVIEIYDDVAMVEFFYKDYKDCTPIIPLVILKKK